MPAPENRGHESFSLSQSRPIETERDRVLSHFSYGHDELLTLPA